MGDVVLVTGGAGFIGSHVARQLIEAGRRVVVLDDLSGGFEENLPRGAELVQGSVVDDALVEGLFAKHRFRHVYHLAAYAAEGLSHFIKRFNYSNNVIGSVTLINAAVRHEAECFVFTSSIAVYGHNQLPMTEAMVPQPEDSYGVAKYAVELELAASERMFGLPFVVFRPHNVYGENQNIGDRYRNVIGIFMNQIMRGEPLSIFGDGEQTRAFTYVGDVAPAIAAAPGVAAARNQVFNIGADRPYTINQLVDVVSAAMGGANPDVTHLEARNEVVHAFSDHSKLERVFGKRAAVPLEEGIARMATWARAHGPRQSKAFEGIEITRNLPAAWRRLD